MGGALGALGVGLSVLFGLFLLVLALEIYYMQRSSRRRRVNDLHGAEAEAGGYVHEAALVGSFGGYPPASSPPEFVAKFFPPAAAEHPPAHLLFTIAEETKEDMMMVMTELQKLPSVKRHVSPSPAPSPSPSSVASSREKTPFATPPSSPSVTGSPFSSSSLESAASHFSVHSPGLQPHPSSSLSSNTASPATAISRFSPSSCSPTTAISNGSSPSISRRQSTDSPSSLLLRGTLGALFHRPSPPAAHYPPSFLNSPEALISGLLSPFSNSPSTSIASSRPCHVELQR